MIKIKIEMCDECGTCISICPVNAIILKKNLEINHQWCISCKKCVSICPFNALTLQADHLPGNSDNE